MITISQLARYAGVSIKTVRVYHDKGLLPEPARDRSGYRRYTAEDVIELIKVRTLAESGVPLARIRELMDLSNDRLQEAIDQIDADLDARLQHLRRTRRRLRDLAAGHVHALLPSPVAEHLAGLAEMGFTPRWIAMESDLWILTFAAYPEFADAWFRDQRDALTVPELRNLYLECDRVHDLDPLDPRVDELADRLADATRHRYGPGDPPGINTGSSVPDLISRSIDASSPTWRRLTSLVRTNLGIRG